jgi:hypothetical protein
MAGISVEAEWISNYAKTIGADAQELSATRKDLGAGSLPVRSFGDLGREMRVSESYGLAADALLGELTKAIAALGSASDGLKKVAGAHNENEQAQADAFNKIYKD